MRFSSRIAAFARRVFPTRCKLTREPGCIGKMTTLATTCNSRFVGSIPHLTGIFAGKTHKNSSDTPTSGSHNSLVQTLIRANFIPLERRRREISDDMLHDPFWAPEDLQNCPRKSGQKRVCAQKPRRIWWGAGMEDKTAMWQVHALRAIITRRVPWWCARRARLPIKPALPPLICTQFCSGTMPSWA